MLIQVQDAVELCRKPVIVVNTGVDQPTRAFNEKCSEVDVYSVKHATLERRNAVNSVDGIIV